SAGTLVANPLYVHTAGVVTLSGLEVRSTTTLSNLSLSFTDNATAPNVAMPLVQNGMSFGAQGDVSVSNLITLASAIDSHAQRPVGGTKVNLNRLTITDGGSD